MRSWATSPSAPKTWEIRSSSSTWRKPAAQGAREPPGISPHCDPCQLRSRQTLKALLKHVHVALVQEVTHVRVELDHVLAPVLVLRAPGHVGERDREVVYVVLVVAQPVGNGVDHLLDHHAALLL